MPETVLCLWFDDQAEEAARHYTAIFPGSSIDAITRNPDGDPADRPAGSVLTVDFTLDGRRYTALNGGPLFTFSEAISIQVFCADQAEVDHYWERLSEGGQEGRCGWLKDRYGLSWQIVPTEWMKAMAADDPERGRRGLQAIMGMGRIVIDDVLRAMDGG